MKGLMMDYQLTIPTILRRAETLFGKKEIVSRLPDTNIHRYTYRDFVKRTKRLSVALRELGLQEGDRVATLCWNHYQHLESYFAIPCTGAIVHPLNLRLSPEDLGYIVNHAGDKILIVDEVLLPLFEKFKDRTKVSSVIVVPQGSKQIPEDYINYEELVAGSDDSLFEPFEGEENTAAFMCYTSGTTGQPKGVLYSHRSIVLHSMAFLLGCTGTGVNEQDTLLAIVPMFHACAWGFPYSCAFVGANQVFPGPHLDGKNLLDLFEKEKVTITAGVPTVMLNILNTLESENTGQTLFLKTIIVGGSAVPRHLVKFFDERFGIRVLHAWGMTETSPLGSTSVMPSKMKDVSKEEQYDYSTKQGLPAPFVEIRGRNESGIIPWDGKTMGELEVRGPWVVSAYYGETEPGEKFTGDGWFKTGDIVAINADGCIEIKDRSKDLIKSGGEWISSVALENTLMSHPHVLEAAVIAVPDTKWMERPFAYVVTRKEKTVSAEELKELLAEKFAKFWIPEGFAFIEAIPKTSVGKFSKITLRDQHMEANK